ncbi:MAG: TIGR00725 family protein [Myxococcota bacterium]|nr:TIGR00725 family protein [Myxococcota bacterium]
MTRLKKDKIASRRYVMGVIGTGHRCTDDQYAAAKTLGELAVDGGFRIVTGGLDGVMEAACKGAHLSARYCNGDTIGILPGSHAEAANPWVDIVIPTGMGVARNVLVVQTADLVVAVGGGSGTLSEMALAWQNQRPLIALEKSGGWASRLANQSLDDRNRLPIQAAATPAQAVALAVALRTTHGADTERRPER